ncbi:MAG TPA: NADPH-dependent FMN reductase [Terriglobales bacterium]|nr:NADPH-dependent FMN reductase [Terriglobales bacterium]
MARYQIGVVVGSLRKESLNRKLADAIAKLAPAEFSFKHLEIGNLPLYNQDDDGHSAEAVTRFKADVAASQAILFVTPEYNRSIPGVLKNALDQGSRPYGQSVWGGKPAGVIGISVGAMGTSMAQQHLRNVLAYLDMRVLAQPEAFLQNREGMFNTDNSVGEASKQFLQNWVDKFAQLVIEHAK